MTDYFGRLRNHKNILAFRPFIMELQRGGRCLALGLTPGSEAEDFPTRTFAESVA
jgi:hypothetical protein